jgi:hypothetical protein
LNFPKELPKELDQDWMIEILDQAKATGCHEGMLNASIEIFDMSHEESISYFERLENI